MKRASLILLALLPLAPLTASGQAEAADPQQEQAESLGRFLKRLTKARPEQIAAMVDAMPDINAATAGERITALHACIAYNRLDIAHLLLQRGANTELMMKPGLTPLSAAAMKNDTDAISLLLQFGARLDHHTRGGVSALKLACAKGNIDAAQVLLAHGADPRPADTEGHTALTLAQEHAGDNRHPLMLMLLEHGANPDTIVSGSKDTPLMLAIISHDLPVASLLLKFGANTELAEEHGCSPLMMAASYGYPALVNELLERGATISRQDGDGNDALDYAAYGARISHALCSVFSGESGQDITLRNPEQVDSKATCRLLLERGANVHHVDRWGSTPLIIAARAGEPENVALFLEHGANINAQDKEGHTALISALLPPEEKARLSFSADSKEDYDSMLRCVIPLFQLLPRTEQTVRLLLEAGADAGLRDASGRCALDYATTPTLQAMLQHAAQGSH